MGTLEGDGRDVTSSRPYSCVKDCRVLKGRHPPSRPRPTGPFTLDEPLQEKKNINSSGYYTVRVMKRT